MQLVRERNRDSQKMMNLMLRILDEGLIHPTSGCMLYYSDTTTRVWGKGQHADLHEMIADLESSRDKGGQMVDELAKKWIDKGEPPNSEMLFLAALAKRDVDQSCFQTRADQTALQAA